MEIAFLKENSRHDEVMRCNIRGITKLSSDISRVLLEDLNSDLIYCLMEGTQWNSKLENLPLDSTVYLSSFTPEIIPAKYAGFYAPQVPNRLVSPLYIHFRPGSDSRFNLEFKQETKKLIYEYRPLAELQELSRNQNFARFTIIGLIIDYVYEDKQRDNIAKLKIVDPSCGEEFIDVNMFFSQGVEDIAKASAVGDILVAYGVELRIFREKLCATYNRNSGGFAVLQGESLEIVSASKGFYRFEDIEQKLEELQDWCDRVLSNRNFFVQSKLPCLGVIKKHKFQEFDILAYVAHIEKNFPSTGKKTLVLCDSTGFTFLELPEHRIPETFSPGVWAKVRSVKYDQIPLSATPHTSVLPVPSTFRLVQEHLNISNPGFQNVINQALEIFFSFSEGSQAIRPTTVTTVQLQDAPLLHEETLLSINCEREFCRYKCLLVGVGPKTGDALYQENQKIRYRGVFYVWSFRQVVPVLVYGDAADIFFRLRGCRKFADGIVTVDETLRYLMTGNKWLEIGIQRKMDSGGVILRLVDTHLVEVSVQCQILSLQIGKWVALCLRSLRTQQIL